MTVCSFSEGSKYGYKDLSTDKIIVPALYDDVPFFLEERTIVFKNGKCGVIDKNGNIIVGFFYDEIYPLFDDLYSVCKGASYSDDWLFGVIKEDGTTIIDFNYKYIDSLGLYIKCYKEASRKRQYGHRREAKEYWNKNGCTIFNKYGYALYNGEPIGTIGNLLQIDNKDTVIKLIDENGKIVFDNEYSAVCWFTDNYYIVRKDINDSWSFGVVDTDDRVLVDFKYKFICPQTDNYLQCFKLCKCESSQGFPNNQNYSDFQDETWLNKEGKVIHIGKAKTLSKTRLAVCSNGGWGVVDNNGKRLLNYGYDSISFCANNIVIAKDKRIGLLSDDAEMIIAPFYNNITCVNIHPNNKWGKNENFGVGTFDTDNNKTGLIHQPSIRFRYGFIDIDYSEYFNIEKFFILSTDEYSELFSIEKGLLKDSQFDTIYPLTESIFCVKRNGYYGVYYAKDETICISCEYQKLIYEGNNIVKICKDNKWGILSIPTNALSQSFNVNIPPKYSEITCLNSSEIHYSAKVCDEYGERFVIVNNKDEEIIFRDDDLGKKFDSHFVWYSSNRIMASANNHYGFVSLYGYTSIPFKYDIIEHRKDGAFDVCIKIPIKDGAFDIPKEFDDEWDEMFFKKIWGVLDIDGREIVPLKYSNPLPENYDNAIVKDAFSGYNGIIRKDGTEYLPCIYQHLCRFDNFHNKSADLSLLFYGYGGYDDNKYGFFGGYIGGAKWGLLNSNGEVVIEAKYDCFKQVGDYLLAGRNGFMLLSGNSEVVLSRKEYSGVYDLYNKDGELIIGGFSMFEEQENCLIFVFGGEWKQRWDEGGNAAYDFNQTSAKGNARWLILDKNLKSIIRKRDGSEFVFKKGSICTITQKEVKGRIINYWNFPLELFSLCKPDFSNGIAIVERDKKQMAVRIYDGVTSELYDGIKIIDNNSFFVKVDDNSVSHIGLRSFQETIISPNEGFVFLTNPVQGLVFGVKSDRTLSNTDNVSVLCIDTSTEPNTIFTAIESIPFEKLVNAMESGDLEIRKRYYNKSTDTDSESIQYYVKDIELFDSTFVECFPYKIQQADKSFYFDNMYWYSDIYELKYTRYEKERRRIEESRASREEQLDYLSDTWDAMTDGMYGDMPDGFDGDYDFLGF